MSLWALSMKPCILSWLIALTSIISLYVLQVALPAFSTLDVQGIVMFHPSSYSVPTLFSLLASFYNVFSCSSCLWFINSTCSHLCIRFSINSVRSILCFSWLSIIRVIDVSTCFSCLLHIRVRCFHLFLLFTSYSVFWYLYQLLYSESQIYEYIARVFYNVVFSTYLGSNAAEKRV